MASAVNANLRPVSPGGDSPGRNHANTRRRGSHTDGVRATARPQRNVPMVGGGLGHDDPTTSAVGWDARVEYTPLHSAVVVPSGETERFIAKEMLSLCDAPGQTSTRVHLEAFLQDLIDDSAQMYKNANYKYYEYKPLTLFTIDSGYEDGLIFTPNNNRLLLLYRSGEAPVLGAHLVNFLVHNRVTRRLYLYTDQLPIYAEDRDAINDYNGGRTKMHIPKLLTEQLVDEIRQRVDDVTEIWLQFPGDRAPFLIVMNRNNQYDYMFGKNDASTAERPWSDATTLRFHSSDQTREYIRDQMFGMYQLEADAFYGFQYNFYDRYYNNSVQRDSYLDHLYNGFVEHRIDERRCQLQLSNPGSGVIHCGECASASATEGGRFDCVLQYAPLTSTGPCPIARYVLCTLNEWYRGHYLGHGLDIATPVIHDVRMAFLKPRVRHKVLAIDAFLKGANPAPGTTSFATAMGRAYGTSHGQDGHWPFASVEDCLKSPEYNTNKMLHHFAKGFNDSTGRPSPEWGNEGDLEWRRSVCQSLSPTKPS